MLRKFGGVVRLSKAQKFLTSKAELIYPKAWNDPIVPLEMQQISVVYTGEPRSRGPVQLEKLIEDRRDFLARQSTLRIYPQSKFRLSASSLGDNGLCLTLGLTDYFDYLCTNHDALLNRKLRRCGRKVHGNEDVYLSNAIGNLVVATTSDGKIPMLLRSSTVATFAGYLDLPGGHPEPDVLMDEVDCDENLSDRVRNELFDSIIREIVEELNLERDNILSANVIGVIRNPEDGYKPEMIFHTRLNLSSRELTERYAQSSNMCEESVELRFWSCGSVFPSTPLGVSVTVPAAAALHLYCLSRETK